MDVLLQRNRQCARTDAKTKVPAIPFLPNRQLCVITCIDPRVDPADILGLELGNAIVARNVAARVTPSVLQDIAWISYLHETKPPTPTGFRSQVIHHTDCGSGLFADDELRHRFAARGFNETELAELPVLDPVTTTVSTDVTTLLDYPNLSANVDVSGHDYDVTTGLLTTINPPAGRQRR